VAVVFAYRAFAGATDDKNQVDAPSETAVKEAERAIGQMKAPPGLKVELVAAEPLLANPVAFCLDERGRIYVAETHRVGGGAGVEDNRGHMHRLDDDLAAQTVEDRVAYIKKHLGARAEDYTKFSERVKILEDTDSDGRMDAARVFATGFNSIADGVGAGVLAHGGDVFYTCIPNLWKLRDTNGDGQADDRKSLHYGYGVRFAFYGHDLHGLTIGPDGRLYFSIGDRGLNVTTADGRKVVNVDSGAVLRCELDGSNLELFCKGLRNPQELAFDDYGNLFTCDNNSDSGDEARWTYLVEGADYGWRMHYQYLRDRGPWNREKLWHPQHEGQAAYIVPCIANITDGPSGITYYPGTGLGEEYKGHFFVSDFRGSASNSCIFTWSQRPKGASFELVGARKFLEGMLVTDCDFGPDGGLYASDWIDGWSGTGRGRIYRVVNPSLAKDSRVAEVKQLLAEGFDKRTTDELVKLLGHIDRRVRQGAQFALAERKAIEPLVEGAKSNKQLLARLHAVWGLGQIVRHDKSLRAMVSGQMTALFEEAPRELQAQIVRVFGDSEVGLKGLRHGDAHLCHLAALAIRKDSHTQALIELLRHDGDHDPVIRHSAAFSLSRLENSSVLERFAADSSPAVRMGVLLAWRRTGNLHIARFLSDEPRLALEAARAIHDVPIDAAMADLAERINQPFGGTDEESDAFFRRVLNANFRLGKAKHGAELAKYAGREDAPEQLRVEAVAMLGDWEKPSPRDRVLGDLRPLESRDPARAAAAFKKELAGVFRGPGAVRRAAGSVAAKLGIREVIPELRATVTDTSLDAATRVAALEAIGALKGSRLDEVVKEALTDREPGLRNAARKAIAVARPAEAVKPLEAALESGELIEKQAALTTLATLDDARADEVLISWLDKLSAGDTPPELGLDVVLSAQERLERKRSSATVKLSERLAKVAPRQESADAASYRLCLVGGDVDRGKDIFFEKIAVSCVRCHKIGDIGGDVGPDLSKTGREKTREYLLEALVEPNKAIAKGFETVVVTLDDGREHVGIVKAETDDELVLVTADVKTITVDKKAMEDRTTGPSAMPTDLIKHLTLRELRDLIEFLVNQKGEPQ
jgi:quinoprotein glucose dehydrogenase